MKFVFVCIVACLGMVFPSICKAVDVLPPLKIEGVKASYSLEGPVMITLTNSSSETIEYGIGVLIMAEDGSWTEYLTNIEDREIVRKAFAIRRLDGNKSIKFVWDPKKVQEPDALRPGTYRFYVACKTKADGFGRELSHNIGSLVGKESRHLMFSDAFKLQP